MDPEERLLVIVEHLAVEISVLVILALSRASCPQRISVVDRSNFRGFLRLGSFLALLRCFLSRLLIPLYAALLGFFLTLFRAFARILKINRNRHEGTIFLKHFTDLIFIAEFIAVVREEQSDFCTDTALRTLTDGILRLAVALPVDRFSAIKIAQSVDMHFISYHES